MYIKYLEFLKEQQSIIGKQDRFKFLEVLERKDVEEIAISLVVGREFTQGNDIDKDNKNIYSCCNPLKNIFFSSGLLIFFSIICCNIRLQSKMVNTEEQCFVLSTLKCQCIDFKFIQNSIRLTFLIIPCETNA